MIIFSFLILVGEFKWPKSLLKQVYFLNSYFGRGLLHLLMGVSLIWMGTHYLLAVIAGSCSLFIFVLDMLVACPCCVEEGYEDIRSLSPPASPLSELSPFFSNEHGGQKHDELDEDAIFLGTAQPHQQPHQYAGGFSKKVERVYK